MGCQTTTSFTETSKELCMAWGDSLVRPSRADTKDTAIAITQAYQDYEAACEQ